MSEIVGRYLSFIIGTLIAIVSLVKTLRLEKQINKVTLNAKFFEEIFFESIIHKIPSQFNKIEFDGKKIILDYDACSDIVTDLLDNAKFYKYFKEEFYLKLKNNLIGIDDLLQSWPDKEYDVDDFVKQKGIMDNKIEALYKVLKQEYSGA